jgi:hypothetical protein
MKRIIFALTVLMNTVVLNAQNITLPSGNTITGGSGNAGIITINATGNGEIILDDKTTIKGNSSVSGFMSIGQKLSITGVNGEGISMGSTKITNLGKGVNSNDAVNVSQLDAVKSSLTLDIKKAKDEAIKTSNDYTDSKFTSLDNKVNTEVARLDKRIGATDTKVADLTKTVESNKAEAKAYTDAESIRAINAENALGNRIDKEAERAREAERELRTDLSLESRRARLAEGAITNEMMGIAAMSAAMSAANGSQIYNSQKRGNLSFGTGFYGNAAAVSAGFSYFVSPNAKISANVASGSNTRAAAAGLGFSFGF